MSLVFPKSLPRPSLLACRNTTIKHPTNRCSRHTSTTPSPLPYDRMSKPASTTQTMTNPDPSSPLSPSPAATSTSTTTEPCPSPTTSPKQQQQQQAPLPKLSAHDFRIYNTMATTMDAFHNRFRSTWTMLYGACTNNQRPAGMSLKQFVAAGVQFCEHLEMHHGIEEQHVFPVLATRMPEFKQGKNAAELLRQHREIHAGLDGFREYLSRCRGGEVELDLKVLKTKMDSWGEVLWRHLDQEVVTLGAENMRRYWSVSEMRRMPL